MEMWFSELHTTNVKLSMRIERQLCSVESDCQRIDVLVSDEFGKFLSPMNMSQSYLENGRSTNEPVEKAKEPAVLTVRITMCLAGS